MPKFIADTFNESKLELELESDSKSKSKSRVIFDPRPELYPDPTGRANKVVRFIRMLTLWEGDFADENFKVNPFQEAIIRRIYGPVGEDGQRIVRIAAIWIPRGNAKTTLAAGLGLAHFMGPELEAGGQIVAAAADRENASIAFNCAYQFIKKDEELESRIRPVESRKFMTHVKSASTFKAISTEAYSKHGLNVSFFIADEIHAWPPTEARKLWKVVTDSMVKRREPLTLIISTAGEGMGGLAWDMWDYSHKVASGEIIDPTFAPIIFAAPEGASWRDEDVWHMANPALAGGFCSIKELRTKAKRAEHFPTDVVDFKRFHLNIWQEGSTAPWVDMEIYDKADPMLPREALLSQPCHVGVDLSSVEDLTCVCAIFPDDIDTSDEEQLEERGFDVLAHFFLPEAGLAKKIEQDQADYLKWAENGWLTITKGNRVDQRVVKDYVLELHENFDVIDVAVDRWNSTAFVTELKDRDCDVIEFGQGFVSMAGPVKELKKKILSGKFRHGGNRLLRMCFANVVTEKDAAENEKFTKSKSRGRIDGATAAAMCVGRMLAHDAEGVQRYRGVFANKERYQKAYDRKDPEVKAEEDKNSVAFDYAIINDMNHPLFAEHKARFERWQDLQLAQEREDF